MIHQGRKLVCEANRAVLAMVGLSLLAGYYTAALAVVPVVGQAAAASVVGWSLPVAYCTAALAVDQLPEKAAAASMFPASER